MKVAKQQLKKSHTRIFVSFSGIHAKQSQLVRVEKKAGKEVTLCIELDEQQNVQDAYPVSKGDMLRSRFQAKQEGEALPHHTFKVKPRAAGITEYIISDTMSIMCRETEHAYEYVLVHQVKTGGRRKTKRKKPEKIEWAECTLFVIEKTAAEYPEGRHEVAGTVAQRNGTAGDGMKASTPGGPKASYVSGTKELYADSANALAVHSPIRMPAMGTFIADAYMATVVLRFLGPGDQVLPQPRAEPLGVIGAS